MGGEISSIITRVGRRQVPKVVNGITIPKIGYDSFEKSDNIPRELFMDRRW